MANSLRMLMGGDSVLELQLKAMSDADEMRGEASLAYREALDCLAVGDKAGAIRARDRAERCERIAAKLAQRVPSC